MHALHTIHKINAQAVLRERERMVSAGKFVVDEYTGLNYLTSHSRDNEAEANALACEIGNKTGHRAQVIHPS
jgi:hypothetical protein